MRLCMCVCVCVSVNSLTLCFMYNMLVIFVVFMNKFGLKTFFLFFANSIVSIETLLLKIVD